MQYICFFFFLLLLLNVGVHKPPSNDSRAHIFIFNLIPKAKISLTNNRSVWQKIVLRKLEMIRCFCCCCCCCCLPVALSLVTSLEASILSAASTLFNYIEQMRQMTIAMRQVPSGSLCTIHRHSTIRWRIRNHTT